jgi:hypothetical protein
VYENKIMRPVETVLRMGEGEDKGVWWKGECHNVSPVRQKKGGGKESRTTLFYIIWKEHLSLTVR